MRPPGSLSWHAILTLSGDTERVVPVERAETGCSPRPQKTRNVAQWAPLRRGNGDSNSGASRLRCWLLFQPPLTGYRD